MGFNYLGMAQWVLKSLVWRILDYFSYRCKILQKKQNSKYQRKLRVDLDPRNLSEFDGLAIDKKLQVHGWSKNGQLSPLYGSSKLSFVRERRSGRDKELFRSAPSNQCPVLSPNDYLGRFHNLIAIDTNTNYFNGGKVSVTSAYHAMPMVSRISETRMLMGELALIETWNIKNSISPENFGWWKVLSSIANLQSGEMGVVGLIVDSDLGNLDKYNSGSEPYFLDNVLPKNVELIYNSDQGDPSHLSTRLIKNCHRSANELIRNQPLAVLDGFKPSSEDLYSHIRYWSLF